MNFYENLIILDPNLDDKAVEDAVERVKNVVIKKGGEILKTENWGQRKLAYVLKKYKKGIFILLIFKALPSTIVELERFYKVFDPLIKFLFIKLKKKQIEAVLASISEAESKNQESSAETTIEQTRADAGLASSREGDKGV